MKHLLTSGLLGLMIVFFLSNPVMAQENIDSTGYPGDNFNLAGALELFKKSDSPEDFEKKLNSEKSEVNNLDLNEDGEIDYIRVVDNMADDAHAIILQVPVSEKESQDVAVIEVEKNGKESALLQIIGNADVYGEEMIIEPFEEEGSGGKGGPDADYNITRVVVNVYFWKPIRFIYRPAYVVYVSPYRWRHYPSYWKPWRPHPYHHYHKHVVVRHHHHRHYHVTKTHRVTHAHKVYTPHRKSSTVVRTRTNTVTVNKTKNRTTVTKSTTTTRSNKSAGAKSAQQRSYSTTKSKSNKSAVHKKPSTQQKSKSYSQKKSTAKSKQGGKSSGKRKKN